MRWQLGEAGFDAGQILSQFVGCRRQGTLPRASFTSPSKARARVIEGNSVEARLLRTPTLVLSSKDGGVLEVLMRRRFLIGCLIVVACVSADGAGER